MQKTGIALQVGPQVGFLVNDFVQINNSFFIIAAAKI